MASANACLVTPGVTDIHLTDPLYTIELEHIIHADSTKTRFTPNGMTYYYWKGHVDLVREHPQEEIATFYPSWQIDDFKEHNIGKLVIRTLEKDVIDIAVITSLVVQERSDEGQKDVIQAYRSSLICRMRWQDSDHSKKALQRVERYAS